MPEIGSTGSPRNSPVTGALSTCSTLVKPLKVYDQLCGVIADYDAEILKYVNSLQPPDSKDSSAPPPASRAKATKFSKLGQEPMRQALYRMSGFDLTTIDGIGVDTAAVIMSELGPDLSVFPDEGHFVSYLRLAPNISISAGKKVQASSGLSPPRGCAMHCAWPQQVCAIRKRHLEPTIAASRDAKASRSPFLRRPASWPNWFIG